MKIIETKLAGVRIIEPKVFGDARGFFLETWSKEKYREAGIDVEFVQDNMSFSTKGVLRGLHFQNPNAQGKLVSVAQGEVYDVAVDIRDGSPTFGEWVGVMLSGEKHNQFWIPPGFAHGFCVVSETAYFTYKCSDIYNPAADGGILWNDPAIGIKWPMVDVVLSEKDKVHPLLKDLPKERLIRYQG
ncbi:dTDP-4-dehydrorhamnose 3,5-epimerase [Massilibacillus massiliensis]|nr:dTDP-4-dehydrorhamnose 3,5-epimerase [Massilibacillus massiliensis]